MAAHSISKRVSAFENQFAVLNRLLGIQVLFLSELWLDNTCLSELCLRGIHDCTIVVSKNVDV